MRWFVALGVACSLLVGCSNAEIDNVSTQSRTTAGSIQMEPSGWPPSVRALLVRDCEEIVVAIVEETEKFQGYFDEINMTPATACVCAINEIEKKYTPDEFYEAAEERRSEVVSIWTEGIMGCVLA